MSLEITNTLANPLLSSSRRNRAGETQRPGIYFRPVPNTPPENSNEPDAPNLRRHLRNLLIAGIGGYLVYSVYPFSRPEKIYHNMTKMPEDIEEPKDKAKVFAMIDQVISDLEYFDGTVGERTIDLLKAFREKFQANGFLYKNLKRTIPAYLDLLPDSKIEIKAEKGSKKINIKVTCKVKKASPGLQVDKLKDFWKFRNNPYARLSFTRLILLEGLLLFDQDITMKRILSIETFKLALTLMLMSQNNDTDFEKITDRITELEEKHLRNLLDPLKVLELSKDKYVLEDAKKLIKELAITESLRFDEEERFLSRQNLNETTLLDFQDNVPRFLASEFNADLNHRKKYYTEDGFSNERARYQSIINSLYRKNPTGEVTSDLIKLAIDIIFASNVDYDPKSGKPPRVKNDNKWDFDFLLTPKYDDSRA